MKTRSFSYPILFLLSAAAGFCAEADDLEQTLQKQKEASARRIYSEQAELEDLNLNVPRSPSEEDLALDRKLNELESNLIKPRSPTAVQPRPRRRPSAVRRMPDRDQNWLLPDAVDENEDDDSILNDSAGDDWIVRELNRRKELREQEKALQEESRQIERLTRETLPGTDSAAREMQPFNTDGQSMGTEQSGLPGIPTYNAPASDLNSRRPIPLSPLSPYGENSESRSSLGSPSRPVSPFSIDSARSSSVFQSSPGESDPASRSDSPFRVPSEQQNTVRPARSAGASDPDPLSPLEQIRRSAPIHRDDPFSDDPASRFKRSIWE